MNNLVVTKHKTICHILALSLFGLYAFGCESQSPVDKVPEEQIDKIPEGQRDVEALVFYDGNPGVDGCGWLILHDQNFHATVNLDSVFMIDSLKVVLTYSFLESNRFCGWRDSGYREIEILEIEKQ
ncbi:hypothetical protein [Marivirga harenae]|uniref:hypothetical protein n=1 Tax=Marivirga harenae TaxID=2010992 RepID=UPI0026DF89E8|nr:hypothetical protein [Marivirga harenae]WKV10860.1 hypothetical protein Q3Y49_11620 [Marivirga harenae]|tara:strand:+ start:139113 stop:139490 length:378 start_codon:yes stop_codon:yes gene_type:complete